MRSVLPLLLLAALSPALAAPRATPVAIRAYLNVSSGCQIATVDLLDSLKARYAPAVSLEVIDFGDQGRGFRRWQQSGYRCLTIELNGSPWAKFPYQGKTQAVAFQMPAGLNWTHEDLTHAVQAGLAGQLTRASQAEIDAYAPARQLNAAVAVGQTAQGGKRYSTVTINGKVALALPGVSADPVRRAKAAAAALQTWLARPVRLSDLSVKQTRYGWAVLAAWQTVATATAADGKALGRQPQALAEGWVGEIKHGLAGPGGH